MGWATLRPQKELSGHYTSYHGSEIISFLGPKIWNILQDMLENTNSIEVFEMQMKQLKS